MTVKELFNLNCGNPNYTIDLYAENENVMNSTTVELIKRYDGIAEEWKNAIVANWTCDGDAGNYFVVVEK